MTDNRGVLVQYVFSIQPYFVRATVDTLSKALSILVTQETKLAVVHLLLNILQFCLFCFLKGKPPGKH